MDYYGIVHFVLLGIAAAVAGAVTGAPPLPGAVACGVVACLLMRGRGRHLVRLATFLTGVALVVAGGFAAGGSGLVALAFAAVLLALFVVWSAGLCVDDGVGVSLSMTFYAALVLAFFLFSGLPLDWSPAARFVLGCVVVGLGIAGWGVCPSLGKLRRARGVGGGVRWPATIASLVGLGCVLSVAFWQPLPWAGERVVGAGERLREAVPQLGRLADWITGRGDAGQADEGAGAEDGADAGQGYSFGRRRELPERADLGLGSATVLHLRIPDRPQFQRFAKGRGYVRSWVLERYIGDGWDEPETASGYRADGDDGRADGWVRLADPRDGTILHEVFLPAAGGAGLPAIQNPTAFRLGFLIETAPDVFEAELRGAVRYAAESSPRVWDDIRRLRPAPAAAPRVVLTDAPSGEFGAALRSLASATLASARTPAEKLDAIRQHLRSNYTYSTRIENPQRRAPMDNFLFGEQAGWCDYFATAAVLMARQAGFPARMAFGYSAGQAFPQEQIVSYRESDAHAWAEVLVEGYGWVVFDATPPGQGAARAPGEGISEPAPDLSGFRTAEVDHREQPVQGAPQPLPPWLHWGVLAIAALVVVGIALRLVRSKGDDDRTRHNHRPATSDSRAPAYLREFFRLCGELGRPAGKGETLRETVAALGECGQTSPELLSMADYHYRVQYEDAPRDRSREGVFKKSLRSMRKAARGN